MVIQNGLTFRKNGIFERADVRVADGRIAQIGENLPVCGGEEILDAAGKYVVPGFVDIHLHGAEGHDFCDGKEDSLKRIAQYERACGVTAFCPATMTLPVEELEEILRRADRFAESAEDAARGTNAGRITDGARILGIHLEGPFLAASRKGAQKEEYLELPDAELFEKLQEASGNRIRVVTLAPELPGAPEFIRALAKKMRQCENPPVISLGHCEADYETAVSAFEAGACHVTHLFNAMPGLHHRQPGVIGAAAEREDVTAELICDGYHVHPSAVRAAFKLFGSDRVCLVSDSTEATGMPDGRYILGGQPVWKKNGVVTLEDGTLAGSAANLYECFRRALSFGIAPESVLKAVTVNPARSIGADDRLGVIEEGACADLLILNENWELEKVL